MIQRDFYQRLTDDEKRLRFKELMSEIAGRARTFVLGKRKNLREEYRKKRMGELRSRIKETRELRRQEGIAEQP